jgi:hypothetical protein
MRGWGQVSANTNGTGSPNYNTGPLMTISFDSSRGGNNGTNWPTNTSPWNAASPNEWNTLMFPIHAESSTQTQTASTPNWASYSNSDLNTATGYGRNTWTQETVDPWFRVNRGEFNIASVYSFYYFYFNDSSFFGLRLVFELI